MTSAVRWTPEQLSAHNKRTAKPAPQRAMQALGRLKAGVMNKTEAAYADHLTALKHTGVIAWFKFEGFKLRLADNTFYTPDFAVMLSTGELQVHEVKGFWTDDARVKIKVAAGMYPFQFIAIKKAKAEWQKEIF
tara:strand:+ start:436667 stop:437068 length:402 start_codon:yes stop_codon:yes gene_type:complete